jgi:hypothetical protein
LADDLSSRLLERRGAPITLNNGYVCVDIDTFAMDNSCTKKENVTRTYQCFDRYALIGSYLGNEGWNIGLELLPGGTALGPLMRSISTKGPFPGSNVRSRLMRQSC